MRITKTSSSSSSSSSSRRRSASLSSVAAETASMAQRPLPPLPPCDQRPNDRPLPPLPGNQNQRSLPPIPAAPADRPLVIAKSSMKSYGSPTSTAHVVDSRANGTSSSTLTKSTCNRRSRSFATADDVATLRRLRGDGGKPQLPPRLAAPLTPSPSFNYDKGLYRINQNNHNHNQKFKVNSVEHCSHCTEKTKDQEKKEKRDMSSV